MTYGWLIAYGIGVYTCASGLLIFNIGREVDYRPRWMMIRAAFVFGWPVTVPLYAIRAWRRDSWTAT